MNRVDVGRIGVPWSAMVCGAALVAPGGQVVSLAGGWVAFENQTAPRLVTADAGVGVDDVAEKDYAWGDVDRDGDIDIVCVRKEPYTTVGRRTNVLFMNEGLADGHGVNGVLVDRTGEYVVQSLTPGDLGFLTPTNDRDVLLVDVNGDAWLDIVTAVTLSDGAPKYISHPRIYINLGEIDGVWQGFRYESDRFPVIATLTNGDTYAPRYNALAAGDVDNDGDMDLYFVDGDSGAVPPLGFDLDDRLFLNSGDGQFEDATSAHLASDLSQSADGAACAMADMNNDGAIDLIKNSATLAPQYVGVIYNDADSAGFFDRIDFVYSLSPYHVSVGDLNNDAWLDLVVTDDNVDRYMLNEGPDARGDAVWQTLPVLSDGTAENVFGGNSVIVDLDNDGFNDVYITSVDLDLPTCENLTHVYHNQGDLPDVTLLEEGGPVPWAPSGVHDVAIFDINGDGLKDLFIGRCTGTEVWMQPALAAPEIVHGVAGVSFEGHSFGGYIDPRSESDNGVSVDLGLSKLVIGFTEPVVDIGGSALTAAAFTLVESGGGSPPSVVGVESLDGQRVRLTLDRIITPQEWLTVVVAAENLSGTALSNLGNLGPGIDEPDRIDVGFLPGDVDQNGHVEPFDLLRFRQLPDIADIQGIPGDFVDADRDGVLMPFDLLRFRQMINGVSPPATRAWAGTSMNHARP